MTLRASQGAQGVTADRVLINADINAHPNLVNSSFAYVAVSRAWNEAMIYTNDSAAITAKLGNETSKSAAIASTPGARTRLGSGVGYHFIEECLEADANRAKTIRKYTSGVQGLGRIGGD